ncbi:hypothetical protein BaRGS_00039105 [Batillaria attramentaria]|uniref:Secreted protein n=1 Tax=Batillaria attramentaria TaxID=370345 RepID=A0ABD0J4C3_9CAEN
MTGCFSLLRTVSVLFIFTLGKNGNPKPLAVHCRLTEAPYATSVRRDGWNGSASPHVECYARTVRAGCAGTQSVSLLEKLDQVRPVYVAVDIFVVIRANNHQVMPAALKGDDLSRQDSACEAAHPSVQFFTLKVVGSNKQINKPGNNMQLNEVCETRSSCAGSCSP